MHGALSVENYNNSELSIFIKFIEEIMFKNYK